MPQNNHSAPENGDSPKIYDNIERSLIDELPGMLAYAQHADFCVGYFNISEWDYVSQGIDNLSGVCRLLIGMHPDGDLYNDEVPTEAIANRLIYSSDHEDQRRLNQLARQLHDGKLQIKFHKKKRLHAKLYLVQRQRKDDPVMCIVGSSNFTRGGLHSNYELNIDVVDFDFTKQLADWFEDRWNDSEDISRNLADIISRDIKDIQQAAIDYSNKLMESDPKNTDAYYMRGKARLDSKRYDDAINDFNKVIELDPEHAYAYCSCGKAYHGKGQYAEAIDNISRAIELAPNSAFAYGSRGKVYYDGEQYDNAVKDFDRALELAPNDPFALDWLERSERSLGYKEEVGEDSSMTHYGSSYHEYYKSGKNHLDRGEYDEAIKDFSKALELKPNDPFAHCSRGKSYHGKGQYGDAFRDFDRAIEFAPKNAFAYGSRGKAHYDSQQYDEAIIDFDRALKLKPKDPFATDWLERSKRALGYKGEDSDKARCGSSHSEYYESGMAHLNRKQYDEAIIDFSKALELKPNDPFAHCSRGRAFHGKRQYNDALKDFDKAVEFAPRDVFARYTRGKARLDSKRYDDAINDFNRIIDELEPGNAYAYCSRGVAYYRKEQYAKAVGDLSEADKLEPNSSFVRNWLEKAKKALRDQEGA